MKKSLGLIKPKNRTPLQELNHDQILSSLMFGEIIDLIQEYEIKHYIFDLQNPDFKSIIGVIAILAISMEENKFSNDSKVNIILNLMRNIRNRAFHWENYKKLGKLMGKFFLTSITRKVK